MADREIIIKMSEEMYNWVNDANKFYDGYGIGDFIDLIKDGASLPKGHGKLVDADKVISDGINKGFCDWYDELKNADAIIDADNEPMQVELEGDGYADGELVYDYGKCPNCNWQYEEGDKDWEEPFCCHCGQRLKWFEE